MPVYVDVLLTLNFLLDYLLLAGVQLIRRYRLQRGRLALAALMGAVGSLVIFFPEFHKNWLRLLLSLSMCVIVEGKRGIKSLLCTWFLFIAISFAAGGVFNFLMEQDKSGHIYYGGGVVYGAVEPLTLLITMGAGYGVLFLYRRFFPDISPKTLTCSAELDLLGQKICCRAFLDTGNQLREPFSAWPVVVLERSRFSANIPDEKQRLIPCRTVQGESLLKAVRGDHLILHSDPPMELEQFYVAFSDEKLAAGGAALLVGKYE